MQRITTNRPPSVISRADPGMLPAADVTSRNIGFDEERWLNEKQAAKLLNVSVKWLQKMRYTGGGIPFERLGKKMIRYKLSKIYFFCEQHTRNNTSQ